MFESLCESSSRNSGNRNSESTSEPKKNSRQQIEPFVHKTSVASFSAQWLPLALDHVSDAILVADRQLKIVMSNPSAETITGWSANESIGKRLGEVFKIFGTDVPTRITSLLDSAHAENEPFDFPHRTLLKNRDGQILFIAGRAVPIRTDNGKPAGVMVVFQDFSERIQLENELVKAQKFESLGVLAGGISHDFNNILTSLSGNLELAKMGLTPESMAYQKLELAEKALCRAGDLNRQLMTFSKGSDLIRRPSQVDQLLTDAIDLSLKGKNVQWELNVEPSVSTIDVDEGQINQVLNNLLINARQAMPDGGVVHISAENTTVQRGTPLPLQQGRYVRITVSDQGAGIAPQMLPKVFDPYFTTKPAGNGLGLSTAYRIVRDHAGHIAVSSALNRGTRFHVYLPALAP